MMYAGSAETKKGRGEELTQLPADYAGFNHESSVEKFGLLRTYCNTQQMPGTGKGLSRNVLTVNHLHPLLLPL